jgi:hypothetical protein
LKRRPPPDSGFHTSVGTEGDILARAEAQNLLESLRLSRLTMEPFVHSIAELEKWGYIVNPPPGPGGDQPSLEGKISNCERCAQPFQVKRMEKADECVHHWGKPYTNRVNGKLQVFPLCVSAIESVQEKRHAFIPAVRALFRTQRDVFMGHTSSTNLRQRIYTPDILSHLCLLPAQLRCWM